MEDAVSGTRTDYSLAAPSGRAVELQDRMLAFMHEHVLPAEARYLASRRQAGPDDHVVPPVIEELKKRVPIWKREHYADGTREWVDATAMKATQVAKE